MSATRLRDTIEDLGALYGTYLNNNINIIVDIGLP